MHFSQIYASPRCKIVHITAMPLKIAEHLALLQMVDCQASIDRPKWRNTEWINVLHEPQEHKHIKNRIGGFQINSPWIM